MKRTDYEKVAPRYDANESRHGIAPDAFLKELVDREEARPLAALDVACGTGNYLAVQRAALGEAVAFKGIDRSAHMLARAKEKLPGVELLEGRAEALPYDDASFHYVSANFAFHHFENKPRAIDEWKRVTKRGGRLRVANIDPRRMPQWWGYRFFPEARLEDEKRFWSTELIAYELEARGYIVYVNVEYSYGPTSVAAICAEAENRDVSQLAILDDTQYERGLARLREILERDANATEPSEIALVTVSAHLP